MEAASNENGWLSSPAAEPRLFAQLLSTIPLRRAVFASNYRFVVSVRDREAAGSNPVAPTTFTRMARRLQPRGPFLSHFSHAESEGHAEGELQLPRLIEHIGRARRLQIRARRDDAVVVRQVLRC